jgi:RNA polymerase sigma-70 factor (ECF subfamily)
VQDAFERAMREPKFLEEVREPAAWLRTAVSRRAISRARRRTVLSRILPRLHEPAREYDEAVADLRQALRSLPPQQRAAVVLRYYADADYDEIAHAIDVEPSSVGPILTRARSKLREALQWHTTTAS